MSLSPDGKSVAIISPMRHGRGAALLIVDLVAAGRPKVVLSSSGDPERLQRCDWSTATRLVCRIYMLASTGLGRLEFVRLVALNSDGSNVKILSANRGGSDRALDIDQGGGTLIDWGSDDAAGSALITRKVIPESTTGTHLAETRAGVGVELVNTVTLSRKLVEQPRANAVEYISDGYGAVRIVGSRNTTQSGYLGDTVHYQYRTADDRDWKTLSDLKEDEGFDPYRVDRDLNLVYGYERLDGRRALYKVALDGTLKRELVFARPDVDLSGLITIGRHQRVVGVSYVTDRRHAEFFDPALRRLRGALAKALPGAPLVNFVDASSDETKLLLFTGSDVDPGRYHLFDKATHRLEEILMARPLLANVKLSPVKPITYAAGDGTQVPGYLTLPVDGPQKGLPAIVLPHGGPGSRDEWGFDWLAQYFAARGFAVLQPNFRGSTGYGDAWFQKNGFQSWRTAVGDVNDGGKWLVSQGIADPARLAILGWSYGGYAALQSAVLDPALFKAIVAVAPVTDLDSLRNESRNFTNFPMVDAFIGNGPHVQEGSPARNAARIKVPVLLFHGTLDRNVGVNESRMMASRLKEAGGKVDYVEFAGLDHYLEDNDARARLLKDSDAFMRRAMGMPAQ